MVTLAKIPRPRTRASLIDHPRYLELRNYVLRFLVQGAKKRPAASAAAITPPAPLAAVA